MEAKTTPQPHTFKSKGSTSEKPPEAGSMLTQFDNQGC